jgi:imidazolonepropionase-like amidohydrolase
MAVKAKCARAAAVLVMVVGGCVAAAFGQVVVKAGTLYTMGPMGTVKGAVVVMEGGKIKAVGPAEGAGAVVVPAGVRVLTAAVVTPGLIDAHSTVGLSGVFNQRHDSDQLESSSPVQPELRAIDAYNPQEPLVGFVRSLGVTVVHTGHAPGELVSGQTMVVKTAGRTVESAKLVEPFAVACTLGPSSEKGGGRAPGTRAKQVSMLRAELLKAQEYDRKQRAFAEKQGAAGEGAKGEGAKGDGEAAAAPARDLRLEVLARVVRGEQPLMVTAQRAQDIQSALRLAAEFKLKLILDGGAECGLLIEEIKAAGVPVFIHPTMARAYGELENMSFETAGKLAKAGVPFAFQAGYESYVPKTRIVLYEAAVAAANGLGFEGALRALTVAPARLLGIEARVGSVEVGKDGDLALFDGDPFEYVTRCVGTVIDGEVVSEGGR